VRAVITGAGAGIGLATSLRLARPGNQLVLVARSTESLARVAADAEARGARALVCPADTSDGPGLDAALADAVEWMGGVDTVVAAAAALAWGPFEQMGRADFDRTVDVTFTGTVNTVRSLLPELRRSRGAVVIVGSVTAQVPVPDMVPYVAAKHALRGFANSLALELERSGAGVDLTYVKPGHISTSLWEESTSATGEELRLPPLSYRVEEVVDEIERVLRRPRREITVGGATRAQTLAFQLARPVYEAIMVRITRFDSTGRPASRPGNLWRPLAEPRLRGRAARGRPSLLGLARRAGLARPSRGRRR